MFKINDNLFEIHNNDQSLIFSLEEIVTCYEINLITDDLSHFHIVSTLFSVQFISNKEMIK